MTGETGRFEVIRKDIQTEADVIVLSLKFRTGCQNGNSDKVSMS